MRRSGEAGFVKRKFYDMAKIELGVVAQSCDDVCDWLLAFGDTELSSIEVICFFTCSVCDVRKDSPQIVQLGRQDQARSRIGLSIVMEVGPDDFACCGFWPPAHQALSGSKRWLRTLPPMALGAELLS